MKIGKWFLLMGMIWMVLAKSPREITDTAAATLAIVFGIMGLFFMSFGKND
jgi:hypothetical protein